ncbi:MAG: M1 family aminopeptidase, partial [Bacteroidota bacterium]|nr:M1 family aminopeptidase [Bacteroidota bacterium]
TYHWMMNGSIPTYLSSVSVANYICISETLNGLLGEIPAKVFVLQKDSINAVDGFKDLSKWLTCFESLFGPYLWEKIGFVSVPFNSGAMEHATMISIPEYSLKEPGNFQDLFIHEFAHNWFGNLVTCASSADMWFNEGWASYCEALYYEYYFGQIAFREYMRKNHLKTLKYAHIQDEAYRALYNTPAEYTYGSTIYDKGADVAHTLRNYIGDEKFFFAMKAMFSEYAFHHISTSEFQSFLEREVEQDLDDFFNFWVKSPGFPHFSIDSFSVYTAVSGYKVKVFFRQKLLGTTEYSYSNHAELMFINSSGNSYSEVIELSGPHDSQEFYISFKPELIILDPYEKIADATLDEIITIREAGNYSFEESSFSMKVNSLSDSVFFRVTRNLVLPDSTGHIFLLDPSGYWTIEALLNKGFKAEARFLYEKSKGNESLRSNFYERKVTDLDLLFRKGPGDHWEDIPSTVVKGNNQIKVVSSMLKNGQYCLGFKK